MFPISDSIKGEKFPFITILLIAITSYVFFLELSASNLESFIMQYALVPKDVDFTNFETLKPFFYSIFLHGGWLHIISNMWFLWIFGDDVEDYFGHFTFLLIYVLSGLVAAFAQYLTMTESAIPMLGASGAVAGILGAYYILFPYSKIKSVVFILFFVTLINVPAPLMLGYWFLLQLIAGVGLVVTSSDVGGIAFFAHIGGFLFGSIATYLLKRRT